MYGYKIVILESRCKVTKKIRKRLAVNKIFCHILCTIDIISLFLQTIDYYGNAKEKQQSNLSHVARLCYPHGGHGHRSRRTELILVAQRDYDGGHRGYRLDCLLGYGSACVRHLFCCQCRAAHRCPEGLGMEILRQDHLCRHRLHPGYLPDAASHATRPASSCRPEIHGLHRGRGVHGCQRGPGTVDRRQYGRVGCGCGHRQQIP